MTEEHKQKIREGIARKHAEKLAAAIAEKPLPFPEILSPDLPKYRLDPDGTVTQIAGTPAGPVSIRETPEPDDRPVSEPSPGPLPDPFKAWLKTTEGFYCSDPRVPQDRVRFSVHLEDVLRKAFNAGIRENEI